jgi:EAL domain-containing protein (putative c-di-GMP-specific phosphodiesterase class I)
LTITIDDFGTGYSSLSYLRRFPIDGLKIDGSFIRNISVNPEDASIVKAIVSMAKSLKLRITAEGVETIEQVKFLLDQEVEEFQGFYFSKPVTVEEVTQLLEDNKTKPISFS